MTPMARLLVGFLNSAPKNAAVSTFSTAVANHFLPGYLVASCGLSPSEANKASKTLSHVKSPDKPNATLEFLRALGLSEAYVRTVVRWHPLVLVASVDNTLRPKVDVLRAAGFSDADVADIIGNNPVILHTNNFVPKLEFLRTYLPEKNDLLRVLRRKTPLLSCNLQQKLEPNAALLLRRGIPPHNIARALLIAPRVFSQSTEYAEQLIERVERIGFTLGCVTFVYALGALSQNSKELLDEKLNVMKDFGWSESDFFTAFRKNPLFINRSSDALRAKMKFLTEEAGIEQGYIVGYPNILFLSLEKRLIPRNQVFQVLRSHGLLHVEPTARLFTQTDEVFIEQFVIRHLNKVPALRNIFPNIDAKEVAAHADNN